MRESKPSWSRFVSAPDGDVVDRLAPVFLCDRLVVRKSLLNPLPALRLYNLNDQCLATARRRFRLREEVVFYGSPPNGREALRICRDNPRIEVEPSFSVFDPYSGFLIGRFEIQEPVEVAANRYWQIQDGQGAVIGRLDDPMSWPQLPCRLDFGARGTTTIEPVFSVARPTFSVQSTVSHREPILRLVSVALAVLLIAVRKRPYPMPMGSTGPA